MSFAFEDVHALVDEAARARLLELLRDAPLVDRSGRGLFVTLQRRRAKLSDREEAKKGLIEVFIGTVARHCGATVPEMRLDLARAFLPTKRRLDHATHRQIEVVGSFSDLSDDSTPSLSEVITQLQEWAARFFDPPLVLRSNREPAPDLRRVQRFNGEQL